MRLDAIAAAITDDSSDRRHAVTRDLEHRGARCRRDWMFALAASLDERRAASLAFVDLGSFLRGSANDEDDEIRWKDFLQFGAQLGGIIGNGRHSVVLAADVSWSPGLYRRDVLVTKPDGTMETRVKEGALTIGVTLAYYVPFFDLN